MTLTREGELRGCIGRFTSLIPLWEVVAAMATEAAFGDPRFPALTKAEYPSRSPGDFSSRTNEENKQYQRNKRSAGTTFYITGRFESGLLLPQVATEKGLDRGASSSGTITYDSQGRNRLGRLEREGHGDICL